MILHTHRVSADETQIKAAALVVPITVILVGRAHRTHRSDRDRFAIAGGKHGPQHQTPIA